MTQNKKDKKSTDVKINVPIKGNKLLKKVLEKINRNEEVKTLWKVINVNAIDRMRFSDHGYVHFQIVANIALRFSRILHKNKVEMSIEKDYQLTYEHAEVVIFLASILHDLGMSIDRQDHEQFSLFLANNILRETLDFLPKKDAVIVTSEVLHAIISHRSGGNPITLEAGIVRVADALDMSEGRSRIPYEAGEKDIYSVSAAAISNVQISEGKDKLIRVKVTMNNSAGVFQVDELLKRKLKGSGIDRHVEVKAVVEGKEKNLVKEYVVK